MGLMCLRCCVIISNSHSSTLGGDRWTFAHRGWLLENSEGFLVLFDDGSGKVVDFVWILHEPVDLLQPFGLEYRKPSNPRSTLFGTVCASVASKSNVNSRPSAVAVRICAFDIIFKDALRLLLPTKL